MHLRPLPFLFLALFGVSAIAARAPEREPLKLTFLANEGFLAEVGEQKLLFDGFLAMPYAGYPALPQELLEKLRKAEAPFDSVELALTSHYHGDHLQTRVARDFLLASPKTPFATTTQAADLLAKTEGWPAESSARVVHHYPKVGATETKEFGEIKVEYLRIPHGGMPDVENLALLVRVGGHTLIHLGDADTNAQAFAPYKELLAEVDLVLVPFWFCSTQAGKDILERYLPAKARVAMHFPKKDQHQVVASFLENHAGVLAFSMPMTTHTFE